METYYGHSPAVNEYGAAMPNLKALGQMLSCSRLLSQRVHIARQYIPGPQSSHMGTPLGSMRTLHPSMDP